MLVDVVKGRNRRVRKLGMLEAMRMVRKTKMEMSRFRGEIDRLMDGCDLRLKKETKSGVCIRGSTSKSG